MGAMASQITSLTIVYSTVYLGTDERKHRSFASLAFVRRISRWPVNSPHTGPVTRKMFPFDDVIMNMNDIITHPEWTRELLRFSRCHAISFVNMTVHLPCFILVWGIPWIYKYFTSQHYNIVTVPIRPSGLAKNHDRNFIHLVARNDSRDVSDLGQMLCQNLVYLYIVPDILPRLGRGIKWNVVAHHSNYNQD